MRPFFAATYCGQKNCLFVSFLFKIYIIYINAIISSNAHILGVK